MKKSLQILFATILLTGFSSNIWAHNIYYWVVGSGNWNTPGNWRVNAAGNTAALTNPQALAYPAATVPPTSADIVYFSSALFTMLTTGRQGVILTPDSRTVTIDGPAFARNIDMSGAPNNPIFLINHPLTITGSLASNVPVTITANNTLSIGGSVTFTANNASLVANSSVSIGGSLTLASSGNITGTTGSLTFTSTAPATIQSAGAVFNMPVTFNGAGGMWVLQDNMVIGRSATFVNGHVVALPLPTTNPLNPNVAPPPFDPQTAVPASPKFAFTASATTSGASHASHVIGYVQRLAVDRNSIPAEFTYPIGNGTYYRPLTSFSPSSTTNLTARYLSVAPVSSSFSGTPALVAPLNSASDKEFWYFNSDGSSAPGVRLSYDHPDPAILDYYYPSRSMGLVVAGLKVSSSGNPSWEEMIGTAVDGSAKLVSSTGIGNSVNWITIGRRGSTMLPVRLLSFTAQYLDGQVQLKWQSASEENTSHFVVEKSTDGKNFSQVLTKKAQGNSTSLVSYSAIDQNPFGGLSYYRLKMVDLDETFAYSKMVTVNAESNAMRVRAYPNPSKGSGIHLAAANGQKLVLVSVSDMFGKPVHFQAGNTSADHVSISFSQPLPAGFYLATLATADDQKEPVKVKFVVQ